MNSSHLGSETNPCEIAKDRLISGEWFEVPGKASSGKTLVYIMEVDSMSAIKYVEEDQPSGQVKELFEQIKKQFGISSVPNVFKAMANKPAFLKALLAMDEAVFAPDKLDAKTKHLIAIAVSAVNGCEYCLYAHTAIAQMVGATNEEIAEALSVVALMSAYNNFNNALGMENDILPK